jgi:hypothetical protein
MHVSLRPIRYLCAAWMLLGSAAAPAHSGGLNAEGCHNNRRTGDYHCHRGAPARAVQADEAGASRAVSAGRPFRNCTEARAAGAAPVRAGEPGYGPHLDRDGDGIGCEPFRGR